MGAGSIARPGFTLIDLLVAIGVIAVLLAMLVPTVTSARAAAKRVECASNIRQQGMAMTARAFDSDERLPRSDAAEGGDNRTGPAPQDSLIVRVEREVGGGRVPIRLVTEWDGLGKLFDERYLTSPEIYYCPAHEGQHPFERYAEAFGSGDGEIVANYQFRAIVGGKRWSTLPSGLTLVANGMRTKSDYSHKIGNNMLKADMSVLWFADTDRSIYNGLPDTEGDVEQAAEGVEQGWGEMDSGAGVPTHHEYDGDHGGVEGDEEQTPSGRG